MKRVLIGLMLMAGLSGIIHAGELDYGVLGGFAGKKVWRSNFSTANNAAGVSIGTKATSVAIATGNVCLGYLQVFSTGNIGTYIDFISFQSTCANYAFATPIATYTFTLDVAPTYDDGIFLNLISTNGWTVKQRGGGVVSYRLMWDYIEAPR